MNFLIVLLSISSFAEVSRTGSGKSATNSTQNNLRTEYACAKSIDDVKLAGKHFHKFNPNSKSETAAFYFPTCEGGRKGFYTLNSNGHALRYNPENLEPTRYGDKQKFHLLMKDPETNQEAHKIFRDITKMGNNDCFMISYLPDELLATPTDVDGKPEKSKQINGVDAVDSAGKWVRKSFVSIIKTLKDKILREEQAFIGNQARCDKTPAVCKKNGPTKLSISGYEYEFSPEKLNSDVQQVICACRGIAKENSSVDEVETALTTFIKEPQMQRLGIGQNLNCD